MKYSFPILITPLTTYEPLDYTEVMTAKELQKWRRVNGYSQSQLARALGVTTQTISRWERGTREITSFLRLALNWLEIEKGKEKRTYEGQHSKKR